MARCVLILAVLSVVIVLCKNCKVLERKVSLNDIAKILKVHNDVRSLIHEGKVPKQPRGINVGPLQWDKRLSRKAQEIADKCMDEHAEVIDKRWSVGQNIYHEITSDYRKYLNATEAIYEWFNEHKDFKFQGTYQKKKKGDPATGHYTQVVWADTKFVGCGYVHFQGKDGYEKLFFCNYGPAGNVVGQPIYKTA